MPYIYVARLFKYLDVTNEDIEINTARLNRFSGMGH